MEYRSDGVLEGSRFSILWALIYVKDDVEQGRKAAQFIAKQCSAEDPGLINRIVLCELVWVLETAYEYPRPSVALALENILRTAEFIV